MLEPPRTPSRSKSRCSPAAERGSAPGILAAAETLFSERGFDGVGIRDVAARAKVTKALVFYHFGNKETLYREAWLNTFNESLKKYPIDGGVAEDARPEDRLHGYIWSKAISIILLPTA